MFFKMSLISWKSVTLLIILPVLEVIPIQLQGEESIKENNVEGSQLNQCMNVQRSADVGVCFGKELLNQLNSYNEAETFSLATGVSFVRDEKTTRDFGSFLDKDPMDFRSMMEDASNLISKRSLHWDLSGLYPGLVMRVGPTLANGVLEFVMDPRIKDRTYHHQGELSTGRLLARNLLIPFLLGFKFQLSTLLPLILGLVLLASKKAFFLAKIALLATTVFAGGNSFGFGGGGGHSSFGDFGGPALSSYTSFEPNHFTGHHHHHGADFHSPYHRPSPHASHEYFYREKSVETSTAQPITPDELRDRLERLFVTKKEIDEPREEIKKRNARNFAWTPLNAG